MVIWDSRSDEKKFSLAYFGGWENFAFSGDSVKFYGSETELFYRLNNLLYNICNVIMQKYNDKCGVFNIFWNFRIEFMFEIWIYKMKRNVTLLDSNDIYNAIRRDLYHVGLQNWHLWNINLFSYVERRTLRDVICW